MSDPKLPQNTVPDDDKNKENQRLPKVLRKAVDTVGQVSSNIGQTTGQVLNNLGRKDLDDSASADDPADLPEEVRSFVNWLRQKNKGPVVAELLPAENSPAGQTVALVRLKESGFLSQNYLFAFATSASEPLTGWLINTTASDQSYGGIALLAQEWSPERFSLEKELSLLVRRDRVRLGKDSAASDYLMDWLTERDKLPKFEKKELIDPRLAQQLQNQTGKTDFYFTGREEALNTLLRTALAPDGMGDNGDPLAAAWIFSIWGQGGLGKSYLLKEFQRRSGPRLLLAQLDHDDMEREGLNEESEAGLLRLINRLAFKLQDNGLPLNEFKDIHKCYVNSQKRRSDSEVGVDYGEVAGGLRKALGGTDAKNISKELAKRSNSLSFLKHVPGVFNVAGILTEVGFGIYDRISQEEQAKNDAVLNSRPVQELTTALLHDLAKFVEESRKKYYLWRRPVLIFDTYEKLGSLADKWLRTVLLKSKDFQALQPLVVIAGRYDLSRFNTRWSEYQAETRLFPLQPFDQTETRQYLEKNKITDPERANQLYELTGGLPVFLYLVATSNSEEEAVRRLKVRILEEIDPAWHGLFVDMAVPDGFNLDTIKRLLSLGDHAKDKPEETAPEIYQYLQQASFVEAKAGRLRYLPIVRNILLRYGELENPDRAQLVRQTIANGSHQ